MKVVGVAISEYPLNTYWAMMHRIRPEIASLKFTNQDTGLLYTSGSRMEPTQPPCTRIGTYLIVDTSSLVTPPKPMLGHRVSGRWSSSSNDWLQHTITLVPWDAFATRLVSWGWKLNRTVMAPFSCPNKLGDSRDLSTEITLKPQTLLFHSMVLSPHTILGAPS